MSEFKRYKRKGLSEMRTVVNGEIFDHRLSISEEDRKAGSPKEGDMIARNPKNHKDQWLVTEEYFNDNLELVKEEIVSEGNFFTRLEEERVKLKDKLQKLNEFFHTKRFKEIDKEQQTLLKIQEKAMDTYLLCLTERLIRL